MISEYDKSTGVGETWTPKNDPVFRKMSFTVEFTEAISVATPVKSEPAWILNCSNVMLCKKFGNSTNKKQEKKNP